MDEVISDECLRVQEAIQRYNQLPEVRTRDTHSKPLGHGAIHATDLDFDVLVEMRRKHQTKQAEKGARKRQGTTTSSKGGVRSALVREFHAALREAQHGEIGVGTGVERQTRWTAHATRGDTSILDEPPLPDIPAGNSANAAAAAATVFKQVGYALTFVTVFIRIC